MKYKAPYTSSLFELLQKLAPESSKNTIKSWIKQGRVEVQGLVIKDVFYQINEGDEIILGPRKFFIEEDIQIFYEDKDLIVIAKPEGLLTVATDYDPKGNVHAILKKRYFKGKVYPVHRLDRETSGLLVFAYSEEAKNHLKKQFELHSIQREYIAVVEGIIHRPEGTWQSFLQEEESSYFVKSIPSNEGKLAITHFHIIKTTKNYTALRLVLETGRKNQIRVHCSEAGHPISGDKKYGAKTNFCKRLCLHAEKLGFTHPSTGKKMLFELKAPKEFYSLSIT